MTQIYESNLTINTDHNNKVSLDITDQTQWQKFNLLDVDDRMFIIYLLMEDEYLIIACTQIYSVQTALNDRQYLQYSTKWSITESPFVVDYHHVECLARLDSQSRIMNPTLTVKIDHVSDA